MERVLQIDPDVVFRGKLSLDLRKKNVLLTGVAKIAEAKQLLLKCQDFFCAVVDVNIEDIPWYESIAMIKSICHDLPIILTTSDNKREIESRARIEGITYYYVKAFPLGELLAALEAVRTIRNFREGKSMKVKSKMVSKKILVVDDDPDYQAAIKEILESGGYSVVQAYSKAEGQERLAKESPDLILLDIMMESTSDGFHFLYETGRNRPPVLAISSISQKTGYKFSPTTDEDFFPADDYLEKPVHANELLSHIAVLLERETPRSEEN